VPAAEGRQPCLAQPGGCLWGRVGLQERQGDLRGQPGEDCLGTRPVCLQQGAELVAGRDLGASRNLTANGAAALLGQACPTGAPAVTRQQLAADLIADVRDLDRRIAAVEERIKAAVTQSKTSLVELFGVGPVLAAKLLGEVGDIGRFPSKHHFATHTGTAPLEASSGQVIRHRLSRAGDRKLNHALHLMAIVQVRHPTAGRAYYRRKRAEGKAPKEALRCLKRRLSDAALLHLVDG
jgi:transposase